MIAAINRSTFTDQGGRFRLEGLPSRTVSIVARKPGYEPHRFAVAIRAGENVEVTLSMRLAVQVLEDVDVTESRRGLYGLVADSARRPLPGAVIEVSGGGTRRVTDSSGRFALPDLKPGAYGLLVSHDAHGSRRVNITIPRGGSREIVVFLSSDSDNRWTAYQLRDAMRDMGIRLNYYPSRLRLDGDELARRGEMRLCDIPGITMVRIRGAPNKSGNPTLVSVIVNGTQVFRAGVMSLCDWRADEVALVEWGWNCRDVTGSVLRLLGEDCGGPRDDPRYLYELYGVWAVIWTR